jgi:pyruvate dehydrogenase E2 component (dihydrolipoamide acetyltransferase)
MGEFRMPSLGADMDAGTVTEWRVRPGDTVHRGDIIAVVDTDKADIDVEVFEDGVVEELLVAPGERVPVGTLLARLGPVDGAAARPAPEPAAPPVVQPGARPTAGRVSPRARRLAGRRGVEVGELAGSGPGGAVTGADVEAASPLPVPAPPEVGEPTGEQRAAERSAAMRAAIARLMARSKREIPHYYLSTDIDFSAAQRFLAARNESRPVSERLLPAVLLLKATAVAVHRVPELNGFWIDDELRPSEAVHLGVAVALRSGGLVAPAIHDADRRDLDDLMSALRDLVNRARAGTLRASEMSDPTITVTNLGDQGVEAVYGVIYPPQVALVGFGAITERAWASDGMVGARPVVTATLAADHRGSDGARGAQFLRAIDHLLQEPERL